MKKNGIYEDVPDYDKKISEIRSRIKELEKARDNGEQIGGGLFHWKEEEFFLTKDHILATAQSKAKKQSEEKIVARLLKSAEKAKYLDFVLYGKKHLSKDNFQKAAKAQRGLFGMGALGVAVGLAANAAAPVIGGAVTLGLALYAKSVLKKRSAHYDLEKLKSYVETGRV